MKKLLYAALAWLLLAACAKEKKPVDPTDFHIIPKPVSLTPGTEVLDWDNKKIAIIAKSADEKNVGNLLAEFLKGKHLTATVAEFSDDADKIALYTAEDPTLGNEGYKLTVDEKGVSITAASAPGLFYGMQTLLQLIPENGKTVPYVTITDQPRFAYRGLHLDVSRHMFPPDFIKKYIDLLAHHKFNRFHWHLTEDQGWRIEIKKYPKLQEIAAFRKETVIGHARHADPKNPKDFDGKRYGGYYTQEEVKDIIKYAADRYVTIIPEIEMPGHALAALSAYPELGCTGGPYQAATTFGVFDDVFCAGKEETFTFLEGVLDEIITLFPSKYIHIGGDECPKDKWEKCPHCKKRMKAENRKNTHELQSYFIQRIEKYINSKDRQIIGWDEILEGGLAPNATVMSWRGEEGGIAAAKQGHDVIMTPTGWCYFDYYQDTTSENEPLAIGGYLPVSKVYSYEPLPAVLTADEAKHILGVQANLWTEYIPTPEHVEYMMYPRACAMAEVAWTTKENRNYEDFLTRLNTHFKQLDAWDVHYAKHLQHAGDSAVVSKK
jgi:hexosaminidase